MSRAAELTLASLFSSPISTPKRESEEDILAGQVNELVKTANLSHLATSSASLSSERISAPTSEASAAVDVASQHLSKGEIQNVASVKDSMREQVDQYIKKVDAFDDASITASIENKPLTAETAIRKINIAWEILQLGLQLEQRIFQNLHEINNELTRLQERPKAILALQQKFINKKELVINEEVKADLAHLKGLDIDLGLDGVEKVSAEKLESIKTVLDGYKSQAQSDTQKQLMNYQQRMQELGSMQDSMKIVIKHQTNLIATISQNMSR